MTEKMIQNFWNKIVKSDGCWKWTASKKDGYGIFGIGNKKTKKAHRISWELHNGQIPDGLHVLHRCDNPECTNPDHLFLGTNLDNVNDMLSKNRGSKPPPMGGWNKKELPEQAIRMMGQYPDHHIAKLFDVNKSVISRRRRALSIPSFAEATGNTGKFFKGMRHPRWN